MPAEVKTSRHFARIWCVLGRPWKPASLLLEVAYRAHRSVRALNHLPVLVLLPSCILAIRASGSYGFFHSLLDPFFCACGPTVHLARAGVLDPRRFGQILQIVIIFLTVVPSHQASQGRVGLPRRRIDGTRLPLHQSFLTR